MRKRKLRTWVKVTLGTMGLVGLSSAVACWTEYGIPSILNSSAPMQETDSSAADETGEIPLPSMPETGVNAEGLLFSPKIIREVYEL